MKLEEILNNTLMLIETITDKNNITKYPYYWLNGEQYIVLPKENHNQFEMNLEQIYKLEIKLLEKFSLQKVYKHLQDVIVNAKINGIVFTDKNSSEIFNKLEEIEPYDSYVIAPISGIRLDKEEKINISIFEIGKQSLLKSILSNEQDGYYIAVKIENIFDNVLAIEEAKDMFLDFIRLVVFFTGKNDKKVIMKIGLPGFKSLTHEQMYVESSSFMVAESIDCVFPQNSTTKNILVDKIPLDNDFFCNNENFEKLWNLYGKKRSKFEDRLLNASIALGESALNKDKKNSIIYTSMAFEILFSYDDGSLFQKSIGDKIADVFAYLIGDSAEHRMEVTKEVKKFYSLRSALVHGGKRKVDDSYIPFNIFLRAAINELLNKEEYQHINKIDDLYLMVKKAQYSYVK